MGNTIKRFLSPNRYAEWRREKECEHSRTNYMIKEIRWIKVPMATDTVTKAFKILRIIAGVLTLGICIFVNNGIKDLSHECIEILCTCKCCGSSQKFTAEIMGDRHTLFKCGYYKREFGARRSCKPTSMTVAYVEAKFGEMDDSFHFMKNNCYHWSNNLWNKLTM